MAWLYALIGGYLLGSIPFGLLITRYVTGTDVREIGSGNIGTTNVLRTGRKDLAALTLLMDAAKAALPAWIAGALLGWPFGLVAGFAALVGHCYPVWLGFRGGKGVATFFGGLIATAPIVAAIAAGTWIGMALIMRYSSLAALTAACVAPIVALVLGRFDIAVFAAALAAVIVFRHRENIARLRDGTESRIGKSKRIE